MPASASERELVAILPAIDTLTDGVMVLDRYLKVRAFNTAYARIFELDADEIRPGASIGDVLRVLAGRGMLDHNPLGGEEEIARRERTWRDESNRHEIRRLRNGRLIEITRHDTPDGGMISIHVDRTTAEEREAEIERQRAMMQSIVSNLSEGVALMDAQSRLVAFNERFLELYRIPPKAVGWGVHFSELAAHFGDLDQLSEERRLREIDRRYRFACDRSRTRIVRSLFDGRTLEVVKKLLPEGGCVITVRDITGELARRRELDEARRRAEASSKHKSAFVAHLSHEMRNSLNAVLGVAALLQRSGLNEAQQGQVDLIANSGQMMVRLINDALDLSRIEAETSGLAVEPFSLSELLDECLRLTEPRARAKGLELREHGTSSPLPPVMGDPVRIKQVVLNLLNNAIKFTETGSVTLGIATDLGPCSARVEIYVADTGIGIDAEKREHVFREFYQLENGAPRREGGVGLGLAICHKLVIAMGGSIDIAGEEPQGTRFTVTLDMAFAEESEGA